MSCFDEKIIEFDDLTEYLQWSNLHYHLQNGVKISGLEALDNGKYKCKYIRLF